MKDMKDMEEGKPWFLQDEAPSVQDRDRDVYQDMSERDDTDGFGADYDAFEKAMMQQKEQDKAPETDRAR